MEPLFYLFIAISTVSLIIMLVICYYSYREYKIIKEYTFDKLTKNFDSLTGIYTKDKFYKETQKLIFDSKNGEFSIFRCDINRFKIVNELFGREFGDHVLQLLAKSIIEIAHGIGTYGRLQNDVFLICLPTKSYSAPQVYSHISESLSNIQDIFSITVCIGVYIIDTPSLSVSLMCDRASLPLKNVKGKIVGGYAYYDNLLHASVLKEQKLFYTINTALHEHQFEIYLQPIYNIKTSQISYAEALVRWKHPTKGLLLPSDFLPYAEKSGFINLIDIYVWKRACQYLKELKNAGKKLIPISVNVSRSSILSSTLSSTLKSLINEYDLEPSYLKLEITEDSYMTMSSDLLNLINSLKDFGFEFFMDDFGSGYSSLGILRDIPFDVIKLDKLFIDGLNSQKKSANFLLSILNMTKTLDIPVIMEGVETKEQIDFLAKNKCDFAQGYYFSKPVTFTEFEKLLDENN